VAFREPGKEDFSEINGNLRSRAAILRCKTRHAQVRRGEEDKKDLGGEEAPGGTTAQHMLRIQPEERSGL